VVRFQGLAAPRTALHPTISGPGPAEFVEIWDGLAQAQAWAAAPNRRRPIPAGAIPKSSPFQRQ